jgi:hypothetical protein
VGAESAVLVEMMDTYIIPNINVLLLYIYTPAIRESGELVVDIFWKSWSLILSCILSIRPPTQHNILT